jgi:type II secretion system protein N
LRSVVIQQAELALGKGRQGAHGVDPVVTFDELKMSGLGVKATRVSVQLANNEPEPGATIDIDSVRVPLLPLLSLLSSNKTFEVQLGLYGGDASASVTIDDKKNVVAADIEIDDVNLARVPALIARLGVPVEGELSADVEFDLGKQAEKEASGQLDVTVKGLGLGAGNLKAVPGGFEIPEGIRLGTLRARVPIKQGQGTVETLHLEGATDVEAEVTGSLDMKQRVQMSRLDLDGWFKPTAAFLEKNPKIKSALELAEKLTLPGAPSLAKAKDDDGRYHFNARGAVQTLRPQLARDNGKKSAKSTRGPASPSIRSEAPSPEGEPAKGGESPEIPE